jgi:hypothetical protein
MNRMGCHRSALRASKPTDHTGGKAASFSNPYPGLTIGTRDGINGINQELIAKHPGHLNGLLDDSVRAGSTTYGGFVPLSEGVSDATGQGLRWGLTNEPMIKN